MEKERWKGGKEREGRGGRVKKKRKSCEGGKGKARKGEGGRGRKERKGRAGGEGKGEMRRKAEKERGER
jgi:hypothetical protein